jgi:hypothetical protein
MIGPWMTSNIFLVMIIMQVKLYLFLDNLYIKLSELCLIFGYERIISIKYYEFSFSFSSNRRLNVLDFFRSMKMRCKEETFNIFEVKSGLTVFLWTSLRAVMKKHQLLHMTIKHKYFYKFCDHDKLLFETLRNTNRDQKRSDLNDSNKVRNQATGLPIKTSQTKV